MKPTAKDINFANYRWACRVQVPPREVWSWKRQKVNGVNVEPPSQMDRVQAD